MTCIYCNGETDTSGACVAQCYWSQNKRFESSNSARWNTRPIEDALRAELEKRTAELHYANTACMEMKHELDRLNAERGWIPVSERLPEPNDYVLVSSTGVDKGVYKMSLSGRAEGWQNNMGWYYAFDSVTHWMPLPPPPPEEK